MAELRDSFINKTLGGCRLIKKIGEGGMGAVYLAKHLGLNKTVAVKILPPSFAREEERVKRFIREARSAAQLEHPHIVQIFNIAKQEGLYFIIMQYIQGENLGMMIRRKERLNPAEATRVIRDSARALASAHEKGVIHRDVKPENIMITPHGDVKLMDFGLARIGDAVSSISSPGDILGTPYYLSPEQAQGEKVDGRSDIYSLGVTYYHALTGQRPFEGTTPVTVILKHINQPLPNPRELTPDIPESICDILKKMMHKNVNARYQTAEALINDLDAVLMPVSVSSPPSHPSIKAVPYEQSSVQQPAKSDKTLLYIGSVAAVIIILIAAWLLMKGGAPPDNNDITVPLKESVLPKESVPLKEVVPAKKSAQEMFESAEEDVRQHPGEYDKNIEQFRRVIEEYPDTIWVAQAQDAIRALKQEKLEELKERLKKRCIGFYEAVKKGRPKTALLFIEPDLRKTLNKNERTKLLRQLRWGKMIIGFKIDKVDVKTGEPDRIYGAVKIIVTLRTFSKRQRRRTDEQIWIYKDDTWYFLRPKERPR